MSFNKENLPRITTPGLSEQSVQIELSQFNDSILTDKERQRKLRKLTQINKELIDKLKQLNEDLTKRISKQKTNPSRASRVSLHTDQNPQDAESTKKQLMNAYKQIDMYKSTLANLKSKQISIDSIDRIKKLQDRIKYEETVIEGLHKQIKYLGTVKETQQKELEMYENDEVKRSVVELEKEVGGLKEKIKVLKKNAQKRDQVQRKQHAYQMELQKSLRKLNDEYYPGKVEEKKVAENKNPSPQFDREITEAEWQQAKSELMELKKRNSENNKKIDSIIRQKNKEQKSVEQNQLKIKQKSRKLQTLNSKLVQLGKLMIVRQNADEPKQSIQYDLASPTRASQNKIVQKKLSTIEEKQVAKKWSIPQEHCLEKGKILPQCSFFSDKTLIKNENKVKIVGIKTWRNQTEAPCFFQFTYKNDEGEIVEGSRPPPNLIASLEEVPFKMSEGDHLHRVKGYFSGKELAGIEFYSKLGKQISIKGLAKMNEGEMFVFEPKNNEIAVNIYGAYLKTNEKSIKICHIGCEFIANW